MTPKSLLRHPKCKSSLDQFLTGTSFHRILEDDDDLRGNARLAPDSEIRRVILCSGKVYFDLLAEREKREINNVYLLRIEQLYPFPSISLSGVASRFPQADVVWCQEEPKNMGAWSFVAPYIEAILTHVDSRVSRPAYVGRPASASTAAGLISKHKMELQSFLDEAYAF